MTWRMTNTPMVKMYVASKRDPLGFFFDFDSECQHTFHELSLKNTLPLDSDIVDYKDMYTEMTTSPNTVSLGRHCDRHKPQTHWIVSPMWKKNLMSDKVLDLFRQILKRLQDDDKKKPLGWVHMFFMSFDKHRKAASRYPVLPSEWLLKKGVLDTILVDLKNKSVLVDEMYKGFGKLLKVYNLHRTFGCVFSPRKICLAHPDPSVKTRKRLYRISQLVEMARKCGLPRGTEHDGRKLLCDSIEKHQPVNLALLVFQRFFKKDLLEGLNPKPRFRVLLKGGYNLRTLLEFKYNIIQSIFTTDLDMIISDMDCRWTMNEIMTYWEKKIKLFLNTCDDFSMKKTVIPHPEERNYMYSIIQIRYRSSDFVDFSFVHQPVPSSVVDKGLSQKLGLPVKKMVYMIHELFDLIVRENIPDMDVHTYKRRNPFTGSAHEKGIRDLYRARTLCRAIQDFPQITVGKKKHVHELCVLSKRLTMSSLHHMTVKQRNTFFRQIRNILEHMK